MALQAVAGSKIYIGTRVALPTDLEVELSDFAPQETEWLEINGWTQTGTLSDTAAAITQSFIGAKRDVTIKGKVKSGSFGKFSALFRQHHENLGDGFLVEAAFFDHQVDILLVVFEGGVFLKVESGHGIIVS